MNAHDLSVPLAAMFAAVIWACGLTPQQAALASEVDIMIAHAPAHGFVTDLKADEFCLP